jgi:hypothetical protein
MTAATINRSHTQMEDLVNDPHRMLLLAARSAGWMAWENDSEATNPLTHFAKGFVRACGDNSPKMTSRIASR